ncbi:tumor necrosis factor receptor superfamily member 1A [Dendropsophus ebraccatus]|uniref:tumor necrosis factor receptor superfamily member 1A n=1 Tax=Dendropsophus ebraccatus TaxID=150705 RepID=UPI003831DF98
MTKLLITISLLWLLPAVRHTLDIPLQSALLIRGKPVGFTRSSQRHKRSEALNGTTTCKEDEYKPRKAKHCCNKCLAGFMVVKDCDREGMKSNCTPCAEGFFRRTPSSSKSCEQCTDCLTQFGQITLQPCSRINDTVCGCPAGQFKSNNDRKFTCVECNKCDHGTVHIPCKADHDSVCQCFHNFYLDPTGRCRSCSECNGTKDCVNHCPAPSPPSGVKKPEQEPDIIRIIIPCVMAFTVLVVGIILVAVNRKKISSVLQTKKPIPTTDMSGSTQVSIPLIGGSTLTGKSDFLPGKAIYVVEESELHQNTALNSSLPLPDITLQTKTPCLNRPEVLYKIIECVPVGSWRELIRRLGVSDQVIDQSEYDYRRYKEAQYAMLSYWVSHEGSSGTARDSLFRVLRDMNLGGCAEKIEESLS